MSGIDTALDSASGMALAVVLDLESDWVLAMVSALAFSLVSESDLVLVLVSALT